MAYNVPRCVVDVGPAGVRPRQSPITIACMEPQIRLASVDSREGLDRTDPDHSLSAAAQGTPGVIVLALGKR